MKAKELRIGNYVYSNEWAIKSYSVDGFINIIKNIDNYKPIPLTEEWLVKFGFYYGESKEDGYLWLKCKMGDMYVRPSYLGGFYWGFDYNNEIHNQNNIKHVHQLQNLYFALTNKQLTTK
jgi:hypothetical protein